MQTWERGPPSALAEISFFFFLFFSFLFSFLVVTALAKTTEGVVVGFQIFAWAPK